MELEVVGPNDRAVVGGNLPPSDTAREKLEQLAKELRATGSAWVNEVQDIKTKEQADLASAFKRQCGDLVKRADDAKDKEKRPHLDANIAIEKFWKGIKGQVEAPLDVVSKKLTAWLAAEEKRQAEEIAAAKALADAKDREALIEAERAAELLTKANRGELAGTGVNTMAVLENAEKANAEAEEARERLDRLEAEKPRAGGQFVVGGVKRSVSLATTRRVALDVPDNIPTKARGKILVAALQKIIPFLDDHGELDAAQAEIVRLSNVVFRKTKGVAIAPGCRVAEDRSAR